MGLGVSFLRVNEKPLVIDDGPHLLSEGSFGLEQRSVSAKGEVVCVPRVLYVPFFAEPEQPPIEALSHHVGQDGGCRGTLSEPLTLFSWETGYTGDARSRWFGHAILTLQAEKDGTFRDVWEEILQIQVKEIPLSNVR